MGRRSGGQIEAVYEAIYLANRDGERPDREAIRDRVTPSVPAHIVDDAVDRMESEGRIFEAGGGYRVTTTVREVVVGP